MRNSGIAQPGEAQHRKQPFAGPRSKPDEIHQTTPSRRSLSAGLLLYSNLTLRLPIQLDLREGKIGQRIPRVQRPQPLANSLAEWRYRYPCKGRRMRIDSPQCCTQQGRGPLDCRAESDETPPPPESTLARMFSPGPATPATPLPSAHVRQRTLRRGSIAAPRQVLRESNRVSSPRHHFERLYVSAPLFVT